MLCPCHSQKEYEECCKPFHEGTAFPKTALALMRSRYSAYALKLARYVIETTYPTRQHSLNEAEIIAWCEACAFTGLEILDFKDGATRATVTFKASIFQNGQEVSFQEKSIFRKIGNRWFYEKGDTR